jgi:transcriptional regulator with XRE-family HTH domain
MTPHELKWRQQVARRFRLVLAHHQPALRPVDVARDLGMATQRVDHWVTGRAVPRPREIARFCERYGVPVNYMVSGRLHELPPALKEAAWQEEYER